MVPRDPIFAAPLRHDRSTTRRRRGAGLGPVLTLLLVLGVAGGGLWLHAHLGGSPLWAVRSVSVEGNRSLSTAELLDRLRLAPGMPWWRLDLQNAAALEKAEPRLASVRVAWDPPRDLIVRVAERESFLRVLTEPPLELATDGILLPADPDLDPIDLPLLTGALPASAAPNRRLEFEGAGRGWGEFLLLARDAPELWKGVSEIQYCGGRDFRIYLREGRRVVLWEAGVNEKLKKTLPEILGDLTRSGHDDVVVDLRFHGQVVLRLPESARDDSSATRASTPASSSGKAEAAAAHESGRRRA